MIHLEKHGHSHALLLRRKCLTQDRLLRGLEGTATEPWNRSVGTSVGSERAIPAEHRASDKDDEASGDIRASVRTARQGSPSKASPGHRDDVCGGRTQVISWNRRAYRNHGCEAWPRLNDRRVGWMHEGSEADRDRTSHLVCLEWFGIGNRGGLRAGHEIERECCRESAVTATY